MQADKLLKPDITHRLTFDQFLGMTDKIFKLRKSVPAEIKEQFDIAKDIYSFSWFRYRLGKVAVLYAYTTLEYALRYRLDGEGRKSGPGLKKLLVIAVKEKWLLDEGIGDYRESRFAELYKFLNNKVKHVDDQEFVKKLPIVIPMLRNKYAHGGPFIMPQNISAIMLVKDAINELYRNKE